MKEDKIKILIVEDDFLIAEDLSVTLNKLGYEIIDIVARAEKALEIIPETHPDIILMDIQLRGKMDGIEAASIIAEQYKKTILIFLSANSDFQTFNRAKQTNPHAFLSKPFKVSDISNAISLALFNKEKEEGLNELEKSIIEESTHSKTKLNDRIFVRTKNIVKKILLKEISHIEAHRVYSMIHKMDGTSVLLSQSLGTTLKLLNHHHFLRVHRSFIANIENIDAFDDQYKHIKINDVNIPVSRSYKEDLIHRLKFL